METRAMMKFLEQTMEDNVRALINRFTADFEAAYKLFLQHANLPDTTLSKVTYYTLCEAMVNQNPMPITEVQMGVLRWLRNAKDYAVWDNVDMVEYAHLCITEEREGV